MNVKNQQQTKQKPDEKINRFLNGRFSHSFRNQIDTKLTGLQIKYYTYEFMC